MRVTTGARSLGETILLQAAIERAAAESERFRRLADVTAKARERFADKEELDLFDAHLVEALRAFARRAQAEVAGLHELAVRHQHGALDRVVEFADVSRPRMLEQDLQRGRLDAGDFLAITLGILAQEVHGEQRD